MKKNFLSYLVIGILFLLSCGFVIVNNNFNAQNFRENADKLSYSLGWQVGKNLSENNINFEMFMRGLTDVRSGRKSLLSNQDLGQTTETLMTLMAIQGGGEGGWNPAIEDCQADLLLPDGISLETF